MDPFVGVDDLFSQFFGGSGLDNLLGMAGPMLTGPRRGRDTVHVLKLSLEDLYVGKLCKLQVQRTVLCNGCGGSGAQQHQHHHHHQQQLRTCGTCGGRGVTVTLQPLGPLGGLMQQRQSTCRECGGRGMTVSERHRCTVCRGRKTASQTKILTVRIEAGMCDGQRLTFQGEGNHEPGATAGDIVVVVKALPHDVFVRRDHDLYMKKTISLNEALSGAMVPFQHLDNRTIVMATDVGKVIRPGSIKCLRGQGFPVHGRSSYRGDLYVEFDVEFPADHWARQLASMGTGDTGGSEEEERRVSAVADRVYGALGALLPHRPVLPPIDENSEHTEHVNLEHYTPSGRRRDRRSEAYAEEDDGMDSHFGHHGLHQAQCTHQ